jgi:hypothetical protein
MLLNHLIEHIVSHFDFICISPRLLVNASKSNHHLQKNKGKAQYKARRV